MSWQKEFDKRLENNGSDLNFYKEKILEAFDKEFGKDGFYVETSIDCNNNYTNTEIKQFISQAIDQTREETIREMEEIIEKGKGYYSSEEMRDGYYILKDLQQSLNKLKK